MSKDVVEKEMIIKAFPEKNEAVFESNSADAMIFLNKHAGTSQKAKVSGDNVNDLLVELREAKISFSFKRG